MLLDENNLLPQLQCGPYIASLIKLCVATSYMFLVTGACNVILTEA